MIYFLAKFFECEEYADQFIQGEMYANRLIYFRELEGDANRADIHEGVSLLEGDLRLTLATDDPPPQKTIITERDLAGPIEVRMDWTKYVNLFCMHAAHRGDYDNIPAYRIDEFKKSQIEIPDICMDFGDHAVVVIDVPEFIKRVKAAIRRCNTYQLIGNQLVRYGGPPPPDITSVDTIFYKNERYKHHREYRFAFSTGETVCDPLVLDIGDISDVAIRCNSCEINKGLDLSFQAR